MTNQNSSDVREKREQTVADYVGDMVALESHIEEALDRQLTETQDDPEARAAVQRFHDMVKRHRDTLKSLQEQVGTTAGNPIIAARSEEHTSELQSRLHLVCRLLLEKKKKL